MNEWMRKDRHVDNHCRDVYKSKTIGKTSIAISWGLGKRGAFKHIIQAFKLWGGSICIDMKDVHDILLSGGEKKKQVTEQHVSSDLTQVRIAYVESICVYLCTERSLEGRSPKCYVVISGWWNLRWFLHFSLNFSILSEFFAMSICILFYKMIKLPSKEKKV